MHPLSPEIVWASTCDGLAQQMRLCFVRQGTWHRMQSYLRGLLSPVERKNGWRIAEAIGAVTPLVLATCSIRRPELACENPSCCLLLLADSSEEEYHLKH